MARWWAFVFAVGVIRMADTSGTIFMKSVQLFGFVIATKRRWRKSTIIRLKTGTSRIGLVINTLKTKYTTGGGSREENISLISRVHIDGDKIEVIDEFLYLGSLMTTDNATNREILRCIVAGNCAYLALRKTLRSNKFSRITKLIIYKTLVRPVGSPSWPQYARVWFLLTEGVEHDLRSRRINHELHKLPRKPPIVQTSKIDRL